MSDLSIEDRIAIGDCIHHFYALVDGGKASRTVELFTPDATLTFGLGSPKPGKIEGPAIAEAMAAREAQTSAFTRHAISNLRFLKTDGGIDVQYLLTLYRSDDESRVSTPAFVADVDERWMLTGPIWQIAARTILPAFFRQ